MKCEDDRGGAEWSVGEGGSCVVQRGWHHRWPQEACGGSDWYKGGQALDPEVAQHLQLDHITLNHYEIHDGMGL